MYIKKLPGPHCAAVSNELQPFAAHVAADVVADVIADVIADVAVFKLLPEPPHATVATRASLCSCNDPLLLTSLCMSVFNELLPVRLCDCVSLL